MLQEVSSTRHLSWPGACGSAKQKTRVIQEEFKMVQNSNI